ncbi:hypothetical protein VE25_14905 [Devosia geojensis]|uniref:Uncharacterized protein n=1 Tax=Devosia geojensis TaxID=443610 RepID=A0A0F5FQE2_9HYPH|nr:hypothetical protein [Devosia geojensis]KKB11066.1 hypothetical protein VE25_14905 [Devosia geojensis]
MPTVPTLEEIEATVLRMEAKWVGSAHFAAYRDLCRRFEADLADPRDLALAKSAALMLIKELEGRDS